MVNLGQDIQGALPELRAQAESMMHTSVTIRRRGEGVRNAETLQVDYTWTTVYQGRGRIRSTGNQPRDIDSSGQRVTEQSPTLSLPVSTSGTVRVDDVAEVTDNPMDSAIVGLKLRIAGIHQQTHSTARRFPVEVISHG